MVTAKKPAKRYRNTDEILAFVPMKIVTVKHETFWNLKVEMTVTGNMMEKKKTSKLVTVRMIL